MNQLDPLSAALWGLIVGALVVLAGVGVATIARL